MAVRVAPKRRPAPPKGPRNTAAYVAEQTGAWREARRHRQVLRCAAARHHQTFGYAVVFVLYFFCVLVRRFFLMTAGRDGQQLAQGVNWTASLP